MWSFASSQIGTEIDSVSCAIDEVGTFGMRESYRDVTSFDNWSVPMDQLKSDNSKSRSDGSTPAEKRKTEEDRNLNETLKDSFPASDPPSTGKATGREKLKSLIDRGPAPVIAPDIEPEQKDG
jgi:hypothetical protein